MVIGVKTYKKRKFFEFTLPIPSITSVIFQYKYFLGCIFHLLILLIFEFDFCFKPNIGGARIIKKYVHKSAVKKRQTKMRLLCKILLCIAGAIISINFLTLFNIKLQILSSINHSLKILNVYNNFFVHSTLSLHSAARVAARQSFHFRNRRHIVIALDRVF